MRSGETLFERLERVAAKNREAYKAAMKDFRDGFTLGETARDREEKENEEKRLLRLDVLEVMG